jgi:beta-mannosidase
VKLPGGSDTSEYPVWPYTRKAAYHFGWDFAPRFVTSGIWKDVFLNSWSGIKLRDVFYQTVSLGENVAILSLHIVIESDEKQIIEAFIDEDTISIELDSGSNYHQKFIHINNPNFWWPNGSGEQFLYEYNLGIIGKNGNLVEIDSQRIGFRTIELVNEPDAIGTSFYFKVNGKPIFMQGANYVPQDVFLPRVKPEQYERLLKQVKDAGMNMLRVWGGGVYEKDIFYDLCDEYGILVWQDFMFAGTLYPGDDGFKKNVITELSQQITRLQKHACLALWCGNNEIEVAWKNWGWQKQNRYSKDDSIQLWQNYDGFFNKYLPVFVRSMGSQKTPYVSTSPQSNWGTPENFNHGSMHYWGVWHGPDDFSGYQKNIGRFMVEWGFQSYPDYDLLAEYISPEFLALNSDVMKNRQKSYVGNGKITDFLQQYNFDFTDFKTFAQQSQHLQALGYEMALKSHIAAQPHCMGTLLWQLNDCWPGPSWSIINYNGTPKAAYWRVKEVLLEPK